MQPQAPISAALTSVIPWGDAKVITYVLNQQGHSLARAGFIQVQKRPRRPEYDINLLAPALDTPSGHPAIWEKLLSHTILAAARLGIERIYVDVPDQPLPVSSFAHVGFTVFARQTIWRLRPQSWDGKPREEGAWPNIRLATDVDDWPLSQLYARITPDRVQQAECGRISDEVKAPILAWPGPGSCRCYIMGSQHDMAAALQIVHGRRGAWLRLWTDMLESSGEPIRQLVRFGLETVWSESKRVPVYIGVNDYHGGLSNVLDELGFAPITDRAKMVKHLLAWVKGEALTPLPTLERVGEAVSTPVP